MRTVELFEIAQEEGCNPYRVLLWFAKGDYKALGLPEYQSRVIGKGKDQEMIEELTISPELRQKSAKDACEYLFPKRKAIEHTGKDGEKLFSYEDFLKTL